MLFPGTLELIQWLFDQKHVKVSFFSAGLERRNRPFVELIRSRAQGEENSRGLEDRVDIFSRHHLTDAGQKDLSVAVSHPEDLKNTVIVDDMISVIPTEQKQHFLYSPTAKSNCFSDFELKCEKYHEDGYRFLKIHYIAAQFAFWWKTNAMRGSSILVIRAEMDFEVKFVDRISHEYRETLLPQEGNEKLIGELKKNSQTQPTPQIFLPGP